jgi:murein DD-endopeptidase MepM/ murein hydrolase activator NlpD
MSADRWTLLLLKGGRSPVRQFSFTQRAVHLCVGGVVAAVLGLTGVATGLSFDSIAHIRARTLARENAALSRELSSIQGRVDKLEGQLGDLSELDQRTRVMAGLEPIDSEVLQVGVGGPSTSTPESSPLWAVDSTLSKSTFAVGYDLNVLERRASLLKMSLVEAADSIAVNTDRISRLPSILPTTGIVTSPFSFSRKHPIHHVNLPHEGIDIAAVTGTPIFAAAKGTIIRAGMEAGYGLMVEIDHGFGYTTRYGHASALLPIAKVGSVVERGQQIAKVGNTGIATASHLHYEVRINGKPVNPLLNNVITGAIP